MAQVFTAPVLRTSSKKERFEKVWRLIKNGEPGEGIITILEEWGEPWVTNIRLLDHIGVLTEGTEGEARFRAYLIQTAKSLEYESKPGRRIQGLRIRLRTLQTVEEWEEFAMYLVGAGLEDVCGEVLLEFLHRCKDSCVRVSFMNTLFSICKTEMQRIHTAYEPCRRLISSVCPALQAMGWNAEAEELQQAFLDFVLPKVVLMRRRTR